MKATCQYGPHFKGLCGLYQHLSPSSPTDTLSAVSPSDICYLVAWGTPAPDWWDTGQRPVSLASWVEGEPETTCSTIGELEVLWLCVSLATLLHGKGF